MAAVLAEGVTALAALAEADTVVCALVGLSGLKPVLAAMDAGHDVALATKEVLVSAGELVMRRRARANVSLLPVDSEHSAVFQCLQGGLDSAAVCCAAFDGKRMTAGDSPAQARNLKQLLLSHITNRAIKVSRQKRRIPIAPMVSRQNDWPIRWHVFFPNDPCPEKHTEKRFEKNL